MFDEEIEKTILYYLIFEKQEVDLIDNDFFLTKNRQIYKAIKELKRKREEVNMLSIKEQIKGKDIEILTYISKIAESKYGTSLEYAYKKLKELTKKRELIRFQKELEKTINETRIENIDICIEKAIKQLQEIKFQTSKEKSFIEAVVQAVEEIEQNMKKKEDYSYYTGFFDLDQLTDGLHQGELTIIGARPGVGKTTFSLQIADNIARKNKNVTYVSLEMSKEQIIQKLIAKRARVNSRKIRNGDLKEEEINKIGLVCGEISELPIRILTKANTIQQIEIEARRMKNTNRLDLLMIDYLQLLRNIGDFKSREQEVADISRTLKILSLELEIPIIALCQLNRNASRNIPTLADIRESGSIEQDADNVIFLYQEDEQNNIVTVDLQKQRAGNIGKSILKFNKVNSEFVNIER